MIQANIFISILPRRKVIKNPTKISRKQEQKKMLIVFLQNLLAMMTK